MKKNTSMLKTVLIVVMVVLFAGVSLAAAFIQFYKPIQNTKEDQLPFNPIPVDKNQNPEDEEMEVTAPKQEAGEYELIDGSYNFLLIGYDRVAELTDVMMIVNFNVNTGKLSILQIPRDTYIDSQYSNVRHMNAVFNQIPSKYLTGSNPDLDRLLYMEKLFEQSLCINIFRSILIDLDGFAKIVDAIGGVDIDIPFDMYYEDPAQDLVIDLTAGPNHLNGEQAEGFVRFRDTYIRADIDRLDAQKIFMSSFLRQIKSMDYNVTNLVKEVLGYVTTDIDVFECLYFAKEAMGIDLSDVRMMTLPTLDYRTGIVMNRESTLNIVNEHMNVYNIEITNSIFDRNRVFTDENDSEINSCYILPANQLHAGNAYISDYTADSVIDESINISQKNH